MENLITNVVRELKWMQTNGTHSGLNWKGEERPVKGWIADTTEQFWGIYKTQKPQLLALGIHLVKLTNGTWKAFSKSKPDDIDKKVFGVALSRASSSDLVIPEPEGYKFLPFQVAGVEYSLTHKNIMLADSMGLGKTCQAIGFCCMDPTIYSVLVVVPAYLKINWKREIDRWYVIREPRVHIINAGDTLPVIYNIDKATNFILINYDILHRYAQALGKFDACILDECFPYDTLISTNLGRLKIGDVVEKNINVKALSFNGNKLEFRKIKRRLKNTVRFDIVKITHQYGEFICTSKHKIYTEHKGYKEAGLLDIGDALRMVWRSGKLGSSQTEVLREKLFCELEKRTTGQEDFSETECKEDWIFESRSEKAGCFLENENKKSNVDSGNKGEGYGEEQGKNLSFEGREWQDNKTATDDFGHDGITNGVCNSNRNGEGSFSKSPKSLQGGLGGNQCEISNRNRWFEPQNPSMEIPRQEKNRGTEFSRVVSVEILERRSGLGPFGGGSEDYFYDLEVEGNHNYFADGILVSNCHYAKGNGTRRSKAVLSLKNRVRRWFALSGTPALNRPIELWNICNLLAPDVFSNYYQFAKRYCGARDLGFGFDVRGCTNALELQGKLRASIMIRRQKEDVLKDLPEKRRQIIELPALPSVQLILEEEKKIWSLHEDTVASLRERRAVAEINDNDAEYMEAGRMIAREFSVSFAEMALLRKKIADHKVPLVHSQITDCLDSGVEKIVVFFYHKNPVETLQKILEKEGHCPLLITGDVKVEDRQSMVDLFQNEPKHKVILGSIGAMGTGITLTASSHVIFGELDWRPGILSQAEDRLHRIGQINSVLVQYLLFADSLDAKMISTVIDKMENLKKVLDEEENDLCDGAFDDDTEKKEVKRRPLKGVNDPEERKLIHEGLRMLAGMDSDMASTRNLAGFSRYDSFLGHRLSGENSLTPRASGVGRNLLFKYHRQLGGLWDILFPGGVK